jgi:hypothetical protein
MIWFMGCSNGGGGDEDSGLPDGEEIQTGDDGGTPGDDGGTPGDDASEIPVELTLDPIDSWQRGPVRVYFSLSGPAGQAVDLTFDYSTDGQTFNPATVLTGYQPDITLDPAGVDGVFVWDSKRDVIGNEAAVTIRGTPRVLGVDHSPDTTGPFELLNVPDRHRKVVVPHPGYDPQGGIGTTASLLVLHTNGVLEDTGRDLECGPGPTLAAFTADGHYGVVLGEGDGHNEHNLTPFVVDRNGVITRLGDTIDIRQMGFSASDLVPAPDGSGIWMTHYTGEGGLYFLSFEGGSPYILPAQPSGYNQFPLTIPAAMAILPDNRRAIISGGALIIDDPPYDVTLVDLQAGIILDQQVMGDGRLSEKVAVNSDGSLVLLPSPVGFAPGQVMAVALQADRITEWHSVAIPDPAWVFIHPGDGAALVTSVEPPGGVFILDLSVYPPIQSQEIPLSLPWELDCVREGSLTGLCLISNVTELATVWLENDGTASVGTPFPFGTGYAAMVSGPAIFP